MMPKISIIVAMDKNRGIGRDNGLLWHIPEELKRFREITTSHPIIMGRKTYESIGSPLPNRTNIVITRDPNFKAEGCIVVDSLEKAIQQAKKAIKTVIPESSVSQESSKTLDPPMLSDRSPDLRRTGSQIVRDDNEEKSRMTGGKAEIFIIGGGQIYKQAMESGIVDKLYITQVSIDPSSQAPQDDGGEVSGDFEPTIFFPEYGHIFTKKVFEKKMEAEGTKDGILQTFKVKFLELEK